MELIEPNWLGSVGIQCLTAAPLALVWLVGVVLTTRHQTRYPASTRLALIGFGLYLVELMLLQPLSQLAFYMVVARNDYDSTRLGLVTGGMSLVHLIVGTIAAGCIVAALKRAWEGEPFREQPVTPLDEPS